MTNDVLLRRIDIEKAKEILKGKFADMAGTELFEYLCFEHQDWFYERFGEEDHHPYTDAVLSYAQCEMRDEGGLFIRSSEEEQ